MAIEKPEYRVLRSIGAIEIREYKEYWLAECDVTAVKDLRSASNQAFNRLFGYISGENSRGQKISMTAPVQQMPDSGGWKVSFVVPSSFSPEHIPVPNGQSIRLRKVEAGKFAALRYRGVWNNRIFDQMRDELLAGVAAAGLEPVGEVSSAVYNPPLTPPILRRNEVLVRIH